MKLTGITGTGTGKLGSSVFAVNSGVQIVRQYQPVVANPSTPSQVEQRAKLKLASQLARDLKLSIAIPRQGLVTSRNAFMSKNFPQISFENETASVNLAGIQLTDSNTSFGSITSVVVNNDQNAVIVNLSGFSAAYWEGGIIAVYRKNSDDSLSFVAEFEAKSLGEDYPGYLSFYDEEHLVHAGDVVYFYAYASVSAEARVKYNNMRVNTGTTLATLLTNRSITANDMQVSKTGYALATASA